MVKRHLMRLNAPKTWKIQRRGITFITRSNPGGMSKTLTMPIANALKYELGIANSMKEVKHLLKYETVLINESKVNAYNHPLCFTDVLSLPSLKKTYRLTIGVDGILTLMEISKEESSLKIVKIFGKSLVKGKMQLNLMDGRNILFDKHHYKVGDALLITLPDQVVKEHLALEKGCTVFLYKGKHVGKTGKLEDIKGDVVRIKSDGEEFETKKEYVLVLGKDHPKLKMSMG